MLVCYFDEVKPNDGFNFYCFGGVVIDSSLLSHIENKIGEFSVETFGSSKLQKSTEFHAKDIYHGKSAFKGESIARRLKVLNWFIEFLEIHRDDIHRVDIRIDCNKLKNPEKSAETAFMFLCERVNSLARQLNSQAMMIGDLDDHQSRKMIGKFAGYRDSGTDWEYSSDLSYLIDTVHFVRSHHSRFIQLSDLFLFLQIHSSTARRGYISEQLSELLSGKNFLWPTKYKHWPN